MGSEVTRVVALSLIWEGGTSAPPGCPEFHILAMSISGDNSFLFSNMPVLPLPLPWGSSVLISITFHPREVRTLEGVLALQTDLISAPSTSISLRGRGMARVHLPILFRYAHAVSFQPTTRRNRDTSYGGGLARSANWP